MPTEVDVAIVGGGPSGAAAAHLLATRGIMWLGAVTPIGGLAFLLGWAALSAAGWCNLGRTQQSGAGSGNTIY